MNKQLEERYVVIKIKDLEGTSNLARLRMFLGDYDIQTRECVVVESDWNCYQTVVDIVLNDDTK